ncbi:MAG TPA: flavin reductase family protein [Bacillota bacterium]|nr:flavin reductase family protein [Bacillota bacterium]HPT88005.1 flavin reductase family protein [Bacillota bacterium]
MKHIEIPVDKVNLDVFQFWKDSLLLTAGENEPGRFNAMTIGWGSLGVMWGMPVAMVVVRPSRYTYEFMEKSPSFTITAFDPSYKEVLALMGSKSGRDMDKVAAAGLTPLPSLKVGAPAFAEARLIIECEKIYADDLNVDTMDPSTLKHYSNGDFHRIYLGKVVAVRQLAE